MSKGRKSLDGRDTRLSNSNGVSYARRAAGDARLNFRTLGILKHLLMTRRRFFFRSQTVFSIDHLHIHAVFWTSVEKTRQYERVNLCAVPCVELRARLEFLHHFFIILFTSVRPPIREVKNSTRNINGNRMFQTKATTTPAVAVFSKKRNMHIVKLRACRCVADSPKREMTVFLSHFNWIVKIKKKQPIL